LRETALALSGWQSRRNYPTLADLYKLATYDAVLQRAGIHLTPAGTDRDEISA
jgi:hypothetical protein